MIPSRPVLRWHGGKWLLAPWIISYFPAHRIYVEPFGGAGSVLMRKKRVYAEVYNDLDDEVVNLFRVLRNAQSAEVLRVMLMLTPFARTEFKAAYERHGDPVERARRLVIRSFMGFGSNGHNIAASTGFRSNSHRSGTTPAQDWKNYADLMNAFAHRLRGVIIENADAKKVMEQHDGPETLHYVDPPYVHETRSRYRTGPAAACYVHEMSDEDHAQLLDFMRGLKGMVILSGYPHALYDDALKDWKRIERVAMADGARERKECLWINPAARDRIELEQAQDQSEMFGEA
jgi:DNA adenine methylase